MDKSRMNKRSGINSTGIKTLITSLSLAAALGLWSLFSNHARDASAATAFNTQGLPSPQSAYSLSNPPPDLILGSGQLPLRQVSLPTSTVGNPNLPIFNNGFPLANNRPQPVARSGSSR